METPVVRRRVVVRFCETGPPHARVEKVETVDEPPEGVTDFRVR